MILLLQQNVTLAVCEEEGGEGGERMQGERDKAIHVHVD